MLVAAVDWSGRLTGADRRIWTAVASCDGLLALEGGRNRDQLGDHLIGLALAEPELVVGLDFGFSLPLWFLDQAGLENGMAVPEALAESWLGNCPSPFWGRRGRCRGPQPQHRLTEQQLAFPAKSVFQIGGAGAVGTGSLRGFPLLRRLRAEGFAIWPFDEPRPATVVEIYPRLLTRRVIKSRPEQRWRYLNERGWPLEGAVSEDAFDAEVSALVMAGHAAELAALPAEVDARMRREGRIWQPATRG